MRVGVPHDRCLAILHAGFTKENTVMFFQPQKVSLNLACKLVFTARRDAA